MYNELESKFNNMELLYNSFSNHNWVICGVLRKLYDNIPTLDIDDKLYKSWDAILNTNDKTWLVSQEMYDILIKYKCEFMPHISCYEFEAYVIGKTFLKCILAENIKKLPLMFLNYTHFDIFLKSIDLLYNQKFNISKIKILFGRIFFPDVYKDYKCPNVKFDIVYALSNKMRDTNINIKLKRLQPYTNYINKYNIKNESDILIECISKFENNGDIITIPEFYNLCKTLNSQSSTKISLKYLQKLSSYNRCVDTICNNLNKVYANILLLVLLKQKEDSITYHNILYKDLDTIYKEKKHINLFEKECS